MLKNLKTKFVSKKDSHGVSSIIGVLVVPSIITSVLELSLVDVVDAKKN